MSNYQSASNAKVVLGAWAGSPSTIKGLNALSLPLGASRKILTVEEFGRDIDTKVTTSAEYDDLSFSGNLVLGDTAGQDALRQLFASNTPITDIRFYLSAVDFCALDLAHDPGGYYQISKFSPGQAQKSGVFPLAVSMSVGGMSALFTKHVSAIANADVKVATSSTISDVNSGFLAAGFAVGDVVIIDASTSNTLLSGIIKTVAAGLITVEGSPFVVDAAAVSKLSVHGGR